MTKLTSAVSCPVFLLLAVAGSSPLSIRAAQSYLYAPSTANGATAYVSAFQISAGGTLTAVPGSPFAVGQFLTSSAMDPLGRFLYVANGNNRNIFGFAIDARTGELAPVPGSPFSIGTDAASVAVDPTGRFVYVTGYNFSEISGYSIQPDTGAITPLPGSPFAMAYRPYSLTFEPSGRFAYVTTVPGSFSTGSVSAYSVDPVTGTLAIIGSAVAIPINGYSPATAVDPTGTFLYVSSDVQVFAYRIDPLAGLLTPVSGSPFLTEVNPTAIAIHPTGRFLYVVNYNLSTISAYAIDSNSGVLLPVPGSPFTTGHQLLGDWPTSLALDPAGRFLYVVSQGSNFWGYAIDPASGALTALSGFPFTAPALGPGYLVTTPSRSQTIDIGVSHIGNFLQGQSNITYSIAVKNSGVAQTTGTVVVTENPPAGLALVSMVGSGWTCAAQGATCKRTDSLAAGASYPLLAVTMNVASSAPSSLTNSVSAFEVGSATAIASDPTTILLPQLLTVQASHLGNFVQGQTAAAYSLAVSNSAGSRPTSGTVTVSDSLPAGLVATAIAGTGWNCALATLSCTRSDSLNGGANYPPIQVLLNVDNSAPSPVSNSVNVSGGGSAATSAGDVTVIVSYASVKACDVDQVGSISVDDVQALLNASLGLSPAGSDLNHDGTTSVIDAQIVINAALGRGCSGG